MTSWLAFNLRSRQAIPSWLAGLQLALPLLLPACLARPVAATLLHTTPGATRTGPPLGPLAALLSHPVIKPPRLVARHVRCTERVILLLQTLLPAKTELGILQLPLLADRAVVGVEALAGLLALALLLLLLTPAAWLVHLCIKVQLTSKAL